MTSLGATAINLVPFPRWHTAEDRELGFLVGSHRFGFRGSPLLFMCGGLGACHTSCSLSASPRLYGTGWMPGCRAAQEVRTRASSPPARARPKATLPAGRRGTPVVSKAGLEEAAGRQREGEGCAPSASSPCAHVSLPGRGWSGGHTAWTRRVLHASEVGRKVERLRRRAVSSPHGGARVPGDKSGCNLHRGAGKGTLAGPGA